jgi:uncharacterized protein YcbK (DUF882 family)
VKLSPHFGAAEFACKCCGEPGDIDPLLVDALEALRALVARPIRINSGYRCPKHNARVGGSPKSQHMAGRAADIRVSNMTGEALYQLAKELPEFRGLGVASNWLHVDTRTGPRSRWRYGAGGKVIAF